MHLSEIEEEAQAFADKQARLEEVEEELETIITELRDAPKKAARETKFAQFVGAESVSEEKVEEMEARQDELADERDRLMAEIEDEREALMRNVASDELVVPLTMEPEEHEHEWVFTFRDGVTFPHSIGFLADTIGLGDPIRVEGVLISQKAVRVPKEEFGLDESEAMEAVIDAFDQLQNTLELKLPDDEGW